MHVESNKQVLIGTVGYHNLSNYSVGPLLMPSLQDLTWPDSVTLEELNWGPIAIVQYFEALEQAFDRVVILTALHRSSREIGDITIHKWAGGLPPEANIQARIGDAVTGVISIENLLVIGEHFKIWPNEVFIVDVEPGPEKPGPELDGILQEKVDEILATVIEISLNGINNNSNLSLIFGNSLIEN